MPITTGELKYFYDRGYDEGIGWQPDMDYTIEEAEHRRALVEWYNTLTKPEKNAYDNGLDDGCRDKDTFQMQPLRRRRKGAL